MKNWTYLKQVSTYILLLKQQYRCLNFKKVWKVGEIGAYLDMNGLWIPSPLICGTERSLRMAPRRCIFTSPVVPSRRTKINVSSSSCRTDSNTITTTSSTNSSAIDITCVTIRWFDGHLWGTLVMNASSTLNSRLVLCSFLRWWGSIWWWCACETVDVTVGFGCTVTLRVFVNFRLHALHSWLNLFQSVTSSPYWFTFRSTFNLPNIFKLSLHARNFCSLFPNVYLRGLGALEVQVLAHQVCYNRY